MKPPDTLNLLLYNSLLSPGMVLGYFAPLPWYTTFLVLWAQPLVHNIRSGVVFQRFLEFYIGLGKKTEF